MTEPIPVVAPLEAIAFFRGKGFEIGFAWQDVWQEEHARAFTVAKVMSRDLLEDIRAAVDRAIAEGETLDQFRAGLRPLLEQKGWWGRKPMTDPLTGETKTVQLGSPRRLKTIFDINMRTSYAAGRWERMERNKAAFPFVRYMTAGDGRVRPQHRAWQGVVKPIGDPWWDTHYPPCDWGCRCSAQPVNQRMMDRRGWTVTEKPPAFLPETYANPRTGEVTKIEAGIAPGFNYNVGKAYLDTLSPAPLPESFGDGTASAAAQPVAQAIAAFLAPFELDGDRARIVTDPGGWPLAIGPGWFRAPDGSLRLPDGATPALLGRIGAAIATPAGIRWVWVKDKRGRAALMRRYAGAGIEVDVGALGWRFREVAQAEAAYNPSQPRRKKGDPRGGEWTRESGGGGGVARMADPPLSDDEVETIRGYSLMDYKTINEQARGEADHGEATKAKMARLDAVVAKGEIGEDAVLFRGVSPEGAKAIRAAGLSPGSVIRDPGFMSTSRDQDISTSNFAEGRGSILMRIQAKKGTPALDIAKHSDLSFEQEVLFPRGTALKVVGWNKRTRTLDVEIVDEG